MPGKKRSPQQRIDKAGQILFESALPNSDEFCFLFSKELEDYGIDGQLQVFINKKHKGEFLKVQLKSKGKAKYIEDGKILSFSLDLESASLLIEQVQDPTTLIIVDNDKKSVYWYPIQTSSEARAAFEKKLLESKAKKPSITLHINTEENLLTPENYQGLYSYLRDAKVKLSKKAMLKVKTEGTLSAGVQHLNEVERQMLNLPGFDYKFRKGDLLSPGTMFSLENSDGKRVDFIPNKKYKPDLAPIVSLKAKFSTKSKEEREKFEAFQKVVQTGIGTIDLDDFNIDSLEVSSGGQRLDDNKQDRGMRISIGPTKSRQLLLFNNGTQEIQYPAEIWAEQDTFFIQTLAGQPLNIKLSFRMGGLKGKFNVSIHPELMSSASHQLLLLDFIRNMKELTVSFIDPAGLKRSLFRAGMDHHSIVTDDEYNFAKALAEIEQKSGVSIPFPLPDKLTREEINNVFWVHRILTQEKITQKITLSFSLQKRPPEHVEKGKYMSLTQSPPQIYLFNRPYIMPEFTQVIVGKITKLDMPKGNDKPTYKMQMDKAEISIKRTAS